LQRLRATAPDDTARAVQEQGQRSLERRLTDVRLAGDAVIAAFSGHRSVTAKTGVRLPLGRAPPVF
jgi:hypothetical protein